MPEVLGDRALNRALLARQLLSRCGDTEPSVVLRRLVAMQAQVPSAPYVGMWARIDGFRPDSLARLITDRAAVRATLLRGTLHLVDAGDYPMLRASTLPMLRRMTAPGGYGAALAGVDVDELLRFGAEMLRARPGTAAELRVALARRWPDHDATALAMVVRNLVPLLHVPPRGLWGRSGQARMTPAVDWLGAGFDPDRAADPEASAAAQDELVLRYLAGYGPASVADAQSWSGLTGLAAAFERVRDRLVEFADERGQRLFDLPDAPRPDPAQRVRVVLLPEYDNCLRGHKDRGRVMSHAARAALATRNDAPRPTVLVDGMVRGSWRTGTGRGRSTLTVTVFERPLTVGESSAVRAEAERLLEFVADGADHTVLLVDRDLAE